MNPPPVSYALSKMKVPHRVFTHPGPVDSLEQAAEERGQLPDQVIRSILFRVAEDEFLMVLVSGPRQISWSKLRKYLGIRRISMATPEEVLTITGYQIGAVGPFGIKSPLRIIVEEGVPRQKEVSLGSGIRGTTIIITADDLLKALGKIEVVGLS